MKDFNGMKWSDLTQEEKNLLMSEARTVDARNSQSVNDGECIVDLLYPYSVSGRVVGGEIIVDQEAVIYNPEA